MKKNDIYIILLGFFLAMTAWFAIIGIQKDNAEGEAVIYKDGKEFKTIPLSHEETITVEDGNGNINVIRIHEGKASIIEANCRDQICVHTRPIQNNGQTIVCLPNRVVVEIRSRIEDVVDGVSE